MQAMTKREARYVLRQQVQIDDTYLGGERSVGKASRGSENKVPFTAAVVLRDEHRPPRVKRTLICGFIQPDGDRCVGQDQSDAL